MKRLTILRYLLILFLFAGMGCKETVLDPSFTIGNEATFRINQLYTSSDGQFTFLITEIRDSRCPEGMQCDWQGEVTLKGEWTVNNNKTLVELHSVVKAQEKQPEEYTIQIVDAKPYPKYDTESKPEDLIVTLLIQKKSKLDALSFSHSLKGWELYSYPKIFPSLIVKR